LGRIEKLCGHHHLLLWICRVWRFALLIHNIEMVAGGSAYAAVLGWGLAVGGLVVVVVVCLILATTIALPTIAGSHFVHEVSIEHGLSHLLLLDVSGLVYAEVAYFCLIKDLIFLWVSSSANGWEHFVDARVVSRLEHDSSVCCVHFVNAQRPILRILRPTLFPHPVSHKEGLVGLLGGKPITYYNFKGVLTFRSFVGSAISSMHL
jgi:hypothetical protein